MLDFDPPGHRELARRLAEESIVLLANDAAALPLDPAGHYAVIGPLAADPLAFFGCYTFPRHVGHAHPGTSPGVPLMPLITALQQELPRARFECARGCDVRDDDSSGFAAAADCARRAELVIAVLGDEAGLFGRGTSGEGCDASDLRLPGKQGELLTELVETGNAGDPGPDHRPAVRDRAAGSRLAAAVQAFFPGQEGGRAIASVLSGQVVPSGKLPIEIPASPAAHHSCYLGAPLAAAAGVSSIDPTPLYPFGHGLSYTTFEYSDLSVSVANGGVANGGAANDGAANGTGPGTGGVAEPAAGPGGRVTIGTDGAAVISCTVMNTGAVPGTEVVQLYLRDPLAQVARPVRSLAGFARVTLAPGQSRRVSFWLHADRTSFTGLSGERIVEAGLIEIGIGASSADLRLHGELDLCGPERQVGSLRVLTTPVTVHDPDDQP